MKDDTSNLLSIRTLVYGTVAGIFQQQMKNRLEDRDCCTVCQNLLHEPNDKSECVTSNKLTSPWG